MIKDWATTLRGMIRKKTVTDTGTPTTQKEISDLLDKADRFDKLMLQPGWEDICRFMVNEVQAQITEAAHFPYEPEKQRVMVLRWDAKRAIVDDVMAYINDTCNERDRLVNQFKTKEQVNG